jgi:hypothetical protein
MSRDLKHLSARVGLIMLALGFSLLGLLSFFFRADGDLGIRPNMEQLCGYLGGGISVFLGAVFLAVACTYWRRSNRFNLPTFQKVANLFSLH